ncbi:MAG: hypothetical protein ABGX82_08650 [Pseudomonas sp.]|uniref:hypothetical protein n=1 Tax=Pseudomonas sp. TaxID=306 RepID=UPI0032423C7C
MTAPRIEAVLFDLAGTLTAADPTPEALLLLPQALPCLQQLAQRPLAAGLLPDQETRDSQPLRPLLKSVLTDSPSLRPFPAPDRVATLAVQMQADCLRHCVLVCGSADAVRAGLNAGLWTIGTALSGALTEQQMQQWEEQDSDTHDRLRLQATMTLMNAGAHYVIDSVNELGSCLDDIEVRLSKAELP